MTTHAAAGHPKLDREAINRFGLWLFFLSETLLFAILLTARFYIEGTFKPDDLDQVLGLGITSVLLLSSLTAYRAEAAAAHGDRSVFLRSLLATIVLGIVFVGGVAIEWSEAEFTRQESFGTVFFAMTGMHAFHVVTGILMLVLLYVNGVRNRLSTESTWPVQSVVMYWHFVDVVWVFFYPALYLIQ